MAPTSTDWYAYKTDEGETIFFYNIKTGEHRWAGACSLEDLGQVCDNPCSGHTERNVSKVIQHGDSTSQWCPYQWKSGETLFYFDKTSGEHKWNLDKNSAKSEIPFEPVVLSDAINNNHPMVQDISDHITLSKRAEDITTSDLMFLRSAVHKRQDNTYQSEECDEYLGSRSDTDDDTSTSAGDDCSNFSDELSGISESEEEDEEVPENINLPTSRYDIANHLNETRVRISSNQSDISENCRAVRLDAITANSVAYAHSVYSSLIHEHNTCRNQETPRDQDINSSKMTPLNLNSQSQLRPVFLYNSGQKEQSVFFTSREVIPDNALVENSQTLLTNDYDCTDVDEVTNTVTPKQSGVSEQTHFTEKSCESLRRTHPSARQQNNNINGNRLCYSFRSLLPIISQLPPSGAISEQQAFINSPRLPDNPKVGNDEFFSSSKSRNVKRTGQIVAFCNGTLVTLSRKLNKEDANNCCYCGKDFRNDEELHRHLVLRHLQFGGPFLCHSCDDSFIAGEDFKKHLSLHNSVKPVKCRHCLMDFSSAELLVSHTSSHLNDPKYRNRINGDKAKHCCRFCEKLFSHVFAFRLHLQTHNEVKYFSCLLCGSWHLNLASLRKHAVIHLREKCLKCGICNKTFRYHKDLLKHQLIHDQVMPIRCDKKKCRMFFPTWDALYRHMRSVHERRRLVPFVCEECGKTFSRGIKLTMHARIHTGEKPMECDKCDKRFRTRVLLKNHKKIHSDIPMYKCKVCDKRFKQKCSMIRHQRTHVAGVRDHCCHVCGNVFTQACSLQRHMRIHSGKRFECPKCTKTFAEAWCMRVHIKKEHSE